MKKVEELENLIIDTIKSNLNDGEIRFSLDENLTKKEIKILRKQLTRRTDFLEDGKVILINYMLLLLDWLRGNQTHQTIIVNYQVI